MKKIFLSILLIIGICTPTLSLISCGSKSQHNNWNDFKNQAENVSAINLKSLLTNDQLIDHNWNPNDAPEFGDNGVPAQFNSKQELSAFIIDRSAGSEHENPINFIIKYQSKIPYNLHNWKENDQNWVTFKLNAIEVTANDLISLVGQKELERFNWTDSDSPIFSESGKPHIKYNGGNSISAMIVSKNFAISNAKPINFTIQYKNITYNLNDWTFIGGSTKKEWDEFKNSAKSVTPFILLNEIKNKKDIWNSFKWFGSASENVWQITDVAEWDVYGGIDSNDPYQGMNGNFAVNDADRTITDIISIKGQEGLSSANPIKCELFGMTHLHYDINQWQFSRILQNQSIAKYQSLIKPIKNLVDIGFRFISDWEKFAKLNFSDVNRQINLDDWLKHYAGIKVYDLVYVKISNPFHDLPVPSSVNMESEYHYPDEGNGSLKYVHFNFTNSSRYMNNAKTCVIAFNYIWNAKITS